MLAPWRDMTDAEYIAATYKPPCRRGDILYVRETWAVRTASRFDASVNIMFKAGGEETVLYFPHGGEDNPNRQEYDYFLQKWDKNGIWHPSIHMPKEAARIWLKVTDVRPERLHDMTLDNFLSEGITLRPEAFNDPENAYQQAKSAFKTLWDSTIRKPELKRYGWDANPWVRAIKFK